MYFFLDSIIPSRCVSDVASPNEEIPKAPSINTQTDSLDDVIKYRNDLFDATKKKQLSNLVPRLEKIEVTQFSCKSRLYFSVL